MAVTILPRPPQTIEVTNTMIMTDVDALGMVGRIRLISLLRVFCLFEKGLHTTARVMRATAVDGGCSVRSGTGRAFGQKLPLAIDL